MPVGPGKYDELATAARLAAKARGVVVIVLEGEHGNGFSVQADGPVTLALPRLLRFVADGIEADLEKGRL
jgi:enoyl-CoA hydratase/carnithine racemase